MYDSRQICIIWYYEIFMIWDNIVSWNTILNHVVRYCIIWNDSILFYHKLLYCNNPYNVILYYLICQDIVLYNMIHMIPYRLCIIIGIEIIYQQSHPFSIFNWGRTRCFLASLVMEIRICIWSLPLKSK